jgi:polygalacturonase
VTDRTRRLAQERHRELCYTLNRILERLGRLESQGHHLMTVVDDLKVIVSNNTTVTGSVVTLLSGLSAQIATITADLAAAGVDVTALKALGDQLTTNTTALAAAVTANTPAAPPVVVPPVVPPVAPPVP